MVISLLNGVSATMLQKWHSHSPSIRTSVYADVMGMDTSGLTGNVQ